jgi:hypothetical protein
MKCNAIKNIVKKVCGKFNNQDIKMKIMENSLSDYDRCEDDFAVY